MGTKQITDITDRLWPLIVGTYDSDIIHISRQNCKRNGSHALLTICGKAIVNSSHRTNLAQRHCPFCEKREDFEAANREYIEKNAAYWAAQKTKDEERREADRQAAALYLEPMKSAVSAAGMKIENETPWKLTIVLCGKRFDITAAKED